jgi:hypothetical protein
MGWKRSGQRWNGGEYRKVFSGETEVSVPFCGRCGGPYKQYKKPSDNIKQKSQKRLGVVTPK